MFDFLDLLGLNNDLNDKLAAGAEPMGLDLDGDGQVDAAVFQNELDTNGDGIPDALITEQHLDLDGDGIVDAVQVDISQNLDQDGIEDAHTVLLTQDTDGDGEPDFLQVGEDFDGDGILDAVESAGAMSVGDAFDTDGIAVNADAPAYVNFDPASADPDRVVGDPVSAMDDWHWQETDSSCAVASQEFVLEELTGREFEESELRDLAEEHGWYDPNGGTAMDDVGNLLEYMGLRVERSSGNSIEDLEKCLANGGEVIVGVDSSEIWMGQNDEFFFPGMDADHAVQVIGIDRTDPDQPMVILNDPGCTNGCGAVLPMEVFQHAWEDSGCFMVEAYA